VGRLQEQSRWLLARVLRGERPLLIELEPGSVERRSGPSVQMITGNLILTNTGKRPIHPFFIGALAARGDGRPIEKGAVSCWDLETNEEILPGGQVQRGAQFGLRTSESFDSIELDVVIYDNQSRPHRGHLSFG